MVTTLSLFDIEHGCLGAWLFIEGRDQGASALLGGGLAGILYSSRYCNIPKPNLNDHDS